MQLLDLLLLVKIGVTLAMVVAPYLFFSDAHIERVNGQAPADRPLMRLYSVALIALCVAYASALSWWRGPDFPKGIVIMGLVSNGGATTLLLLDRHTLTERKTALFFGSVTIGLGLALIFPDIATAPI